MKHKNKNKEIIVYIFKNIDSLDNSFGGICAITRKKDLAELYRENRSKKKIKMNKVKMTKEEYAELMNDKGGMDFEIGFHDLITESIDDNGKIEEEYVEIVCTNMEYQDVDSDFLEIYELNDEYFWYYSIDPSILSKKYKEALDKILFSDFRKMLIYNEDENPYEDYSFKPFSLNELGIFILKFNDIL